MIDKGLFLTFIWSFVWDEWTMNKPSIVEQKKQFPVSGEGQATFVMNNGRTVVSYQAKKVGSSQTKKMVSFQTKKMVSSNTKDVFVGISTVEKHLELVEKQ